MKLKSTLRAFLAIAGSSLLTITYVSATPYYWDSNNDIAGFGATAGIWSSSVSSATGNGFTTSAAGTADITGNAAVATATTDDIFFGRGVNLTQATTLNGDATVTCASTAGLEVGMTVTASTALMIPASTTVASITDGTTFELSVVATGTSIGTMAAYFPYTGGAKISGTVNANSIYQNSAHGNFTVELTPIINFADAGTYETGKANTAPAAMAITGAATSVTWKVPYSSSFNIGNFTSNTTGVNIIAGPGRVAVNGLVTGGVAANNELGVPGTPATLPPVAGTPLQFDGGILRMATGFNAYLGATAADYSLSGLNTRHPVTINNNKELGFDNQIANTTFIVDQALTMGTGGFSVEGRNDASIQMDDTGNTYTGATKLISGKSLIISDPAHIGASTAPIYFSSLMVINGDTMTTLGSRQVVIRGGSTMKLEIASSSNTFTVGQTLIDNVGGAGQGAPYFAGTDVAGTCGVTKTGAGTLVLSATDNSYTGATTVTAGTLSVTGSLGTTAVSITTSTLSGNGNFGGNVTIAATGTHRLAVAATADAQDTSVIAGTLALTAGNTLDLTAASPPAAGEYVLATAPTISGTPTTITGTPAGGTVTVDNLSTPNRLVLTIAGGSAPEIDVNQDGDIANAGSKGFGTVTLGSNNSLIFTINNTGDAALNLTGTPLVDITGTNAADFTVTAVPTTPIGFSPNPNSTTFTVQFAPGGAGARSALLTIANNDSDEDPFTINVSGTGQTQYQAWATLNGAGANLSDDHDGDGVDNGTEYFIGGPTGNTTGFTPLPGVTDTLGVLSVTYTKAAGYTGVYNTDFVVETSSTLADPWTPEIADPNLGFTVTFPTPNEVKYTFQAGTVNFARLKVTGP